MTLSIVGLNDVHGQVGAADDTGGIVAVSAFVDALRTARADDNGAVLVIDAGDMWQGTLESNLVEGASMVQAYNALGIAAATIGNHEFDFGPLGEKAIPVSADDDPRGALKQRAREANFPLLAANLIDTNTGAPVTWDNVQPSVMVDVQELQIGIIGVVTSRALITTIAANTGGLAIAPLAETVNRHARRLRGEGAALVIVAAHAGGRCEDFSNPDDLSSCVADAEIMRFARDIEPGLVDHVIAGHNHNRIAHVVNGISITSNHSRANSFGRVDFVIDRARQEVIDRHVFPPQETLTSATVYEDHALVQDPDLVRIAAAAAARAADLKSEKLGVFLTGPFEIVRDIESALPNIMTEAMLDSFDADIAIHNVFGGIRSGLPAGDLTYGHVYEMFPFDNVVTIHELSGKDLRTMVARKVSTLRKFGFAGMRVFASCNDDKMSVAMILDNGRTIEDRDAVRVIANDFLALGGDDFMTPAIPEGGFKLSFELPRTRDVLLDWFRDRPGTLDPADFRTHGTPKWNSTTPIPDTCSL